MEVSRHMRASSPPASAADILEAQSQKKRPFRRVSDTFLCDSPTVKLGGSTKSVGLVMNFIKKKMLGEIAPIESRDKNFQFKIFGTKKMLL